MDAGCPTEFHVPASHLIRRNPATLPKESAGWRATLRLEFAACNDATILARNLHNGPLVVQKALYPEGPAVCHALILHPPGGIVGNDKLDIGVKLHAGSQALITMPGAAKWYRSNGAEASQRLDIRVESGAVLEWLPPETILFNGAIARLQSTIDIAAGGSYVGWEILCLGRSASGEKFDAGDLRQAVDISVDGKPVWGERCRMQGGSPMLKSPAALAGAPVSGIMLAAGKNIPSPLLSQCREVASERPARTGVSALPNLLVARYIGHSAEEARQYFTGLWRHLRPFMAGRDVVLPRIWST
jgi:urease accessory protein